MADEGKIYSFLEAKQKIEAWCAYRDRCHSETYDKLRSYGLDEEDTHILIADLISNRFLDEQRFAESYVSGKFRIKKWGRVKIKMHLKALQIPDRCVVEAFKQIEEEEYNQTLSDLAQKKWLSLQGTSFEKKVKVRNFLLSKGYENDLIYNVLDKFL